MTTQKTMSPRNWVELLLLALIWAGTFIAVGISVKEVGVFTLVAFRVIGGTVLLWAYVLATGLPIPKSLKIWGALLVMGLLNNITPFLLIAWGQSHIEAGLASILNGSTAVFGVLVAAAVFTDEQLTRNKIIGVTLGFIGVATAIGLSALKTFDLTSLAQLAVLGAGLSYAVAATWGRLFLKDLSPLVAAAGMTGFSGLIMGTLALRFDGIPSFNYTPATWASLIYMATFATAFAYLLYYRILSTAGSGNLSLVTLLIPPFTILMGSLLLNETLTSKAIIGFFILAAGLLIMDGRVLRLLSRKGQG